MESTSHTNYRQTLSQVFADRRLRNPAYSLRSFARDLSVSASMLSDVMNYKKSLSVKSAAKIKDTLNLSKSESELFLLSVEFEQKNPFQTQDQVREKIEERHLMGRVLILNDDRFKLISDFRHFVVFAMLGLKGFKFNMSWIAGMIGGFQFQVTEIFKRLQKLNIVRMNERGQPVLNQDAVFSDDGVPSEALRSYHRGTLQHAIESIQSVPVAERDYHSYIFAIDQSDFQNIQAEVREFHRQLYKKYGRKPTANRVYGIQSQFVPYTKRSDL